MSVIKQWALKLVLIFICIVLFYTGYIFNFTPPIQVIVKKTFLVAWWYLLTYIFRRLRLGKIYWNEDDKKVYYFILLLGSALIFAWG